MRRTLVAVLVAFVAAVPAAAQPASDTTCRAAFRAYDAAVKGFSMARDDGQALHSMISRAAQRVRRADCLTALDDLRALERLQRQVAGSVTFESGASIRPVALQVGIVPGYADEFAARRFFGELGYRVRSQGAPGLGRRIYLGPFATEGGIAAAADLARRAGFVAPYARLF